MFSPRVVIFSKLFYCAAAAGNRSCRKKSKKMLFFWDFRRHVRQFFGVVLELARPSEARCFPPAGDFFEAVLLQQPQATEGNRSCRKMLFFEDFRRHVRQFFGVVLELARPSEARCFPPGR